MSLTMGGSYIGNLPAASIDRAAAQWPGEEDAFRVCMRAMDRAYLEIARRDPKAPRVRKDKAFGPADMTALGR